MPLTMARCVLFAEPAAPERCSAVTLSAAGGRAARARSPRLGWCSRSSISPSPCVTCDEARDFYVHTLGCQSARARAGFTDVWFFGMQLTLQDRPDEVAGAGREGLASLRRHARS